MMARAHIPATGPTRLGAAVSLCLAAVSAGAQEGERPPECEYLASEGRILPWGGYGYKGVPVFIQPAGKGIVAWGASHPTRDYLELLVMQHCSTGRELAISLPQVGGDRAIDRWSDLVESKGSFTFRQVAQEMERLGAKASMHDGLSFGTCACDEAATW